jgi:hypothetical protein
LDRTKAGAVSKVLKKGQKNLPHRLNDLKLKGLLIESQR